MKTFLTLLFLTLATALQADNFTTLKVVMTNNPADGNTLVVNGVTTTFKTVVTDITTQTAIGAAALDTANNLFAHVVAYPLTDISVVQSAGTNLSYSAKINTSITSSKTGTWGTLTTTTTPATQFVLSLPLSGEPSSRRGISANNLVDGLRDYATTALPATSIVTGQLVSTGTSQTISGAKTFTAANIYSNASQVIAGGAVTNAELNKVNIKAKTNNVAQGIYFYDTNGVAVAVLMADINTGYPVLLSIFSGLPYNAFSSVPSAGSVLNAASGDFRYGQLSATPNTWLGTNKFAQITNTFIVGGSASNVVLTNVTLGASKAWITDPVLKGDVLITNSAATSSSLVFFNGGAASDEKRWDIRTVDNEIRGTTYSDDLLSYANWFVAKRFDSFVTNISFYSTGELTISGNDKIFIATPRTVAASVIVVGGDATPPTSLVYGVWLENGTSASADPSNGSANWANGSEWLYRSATANEGAGRNNRVHNRAAEVTGSGTDYAFPSTAYARVDFGGTDPEIVLPTDGTYLVQATVALVNGATASDAYSFKFYNSTDAADIANSEQTKSALAASVQDQVVLRNVVTVAASKTLQLYGKNATAARGSVKSTQTLLSYVRLY